MNLPIISQLSGQMQTALLLVLLILAFVVAFKIMQMVFQTLVVSVISGVFYISLVYLFNYPFSLNNLLLYSFLGSSLYMFYSFLVSAYSIASSLLEIPYSLTKLLLKPFRYLYREAKEEFKLYSMKKDKPGKEKESDSSGNTKEVVLDKVKKED